jgi:hypothetical protein
LLVTDCYAAIGFSFRVATSLQDNTETPLCFVNSNSETGGCNNAMRWEPQIIMAFDQIMAFYLIVNLLKGQPTIIWEPRQAHGTRKYNPCFALCSAKLRNKSPLKNAQEQTKCQFLDMPSMVHGSIEHAGSIPATVVLFLCFSSFFAA